MTAQNPPDSTHDPLRPDPGRRSGRPVMASGIIIALTLIAGATAVLALVITDLAITA